MIELEQALSAPATAMLDDVALVLGELVNNAVDAAGGTIVVTLDLHLYTLSISVADHGPGWPVMQPRSTDRPHGRGLTLVDALTAEWGVDGDEGGKRVWARIAVPGELTGSLDCSHR